MEGKQLKVQKAGLGKTGGGGGGGGAAAAALPDGPVNVYLAGFDPATFGMNELKELFAPFGNILSVRVHQSQPGKKGANVRFL